MYSDSEMIMDSLAEFLETLLRRHTEDEGVLEGLSVAGSRIIGNISNANANSASSLHNFEQYLNAEITERRSILSELVSAIGLQRFRFNDRLANGKEYLFVNKLQNRFLLTKFVLLLAQVILACADPSQALQGPSQLLLRQKLSLESSKTLIEVL